MDKNVFKRMFEKSMMGLGLEKEKSLKYNYYRFFKIDKEFILEIRISHSLYDKKYMIHYTFFLETGDTNNIDELYEKKYFCVSNTSTLHYLTIEKEECKKFLENELKYKVLSPLNAGVHYIKNHYMKLYRPIFHSYEEGLKIISNIEN